LPTEHSHSKALFFTSFNVASILMHIMLMHNAVCPQSTSKSPSFHKSGSWRILMAYAHAYRCLP
jgi:hypothetical protein